MAELVFNPYRFATVQRQIVRLCILYEHKNLVIRQSRKQQLIPQLWQMITSKNFYIFSHFISRRVAVLLRSNGLQRKKTVICTSAHNSALLIVTEQTVFLLFCLSQFIQIIQIRLYHKTLQLQPFPPRDGKLKKFQKFFLKIA